MREVRYSKVLVFVAVSGFVSIGHAQSGPDPELSAVSMWASKYATEGRDNLDSGGIVSVEGAAQWRQLAVGAWYGTGDSDSYEEFNLSMVYGFETGPVEAYAGYTRLEFLKSRESDNEFSAGIAITGIPTLVPALDYTYSTEAGGGFLEVSLRQLNAFRDGRVTLEPYVSQSFDFGYASSAYDGPNNFQAGIDLSLELTEQLSLVASVVHSWAHEDVSNDGGGDLSWGSIGLAASF